MQHASDAPAGLSPALTGRTQERAAFGRRAFLHACALDVQARKPGNVSLASPGHGMTASQFLASARAAADPIAAAGAPVGERIEAAVAASWLAAGCNTNLGIVLLCAPLLAAHECDDARGLRAAVAAVLRRLDRADARAAFRAIAQANPGGLGRASEQDVAAPPSVGLREAMALAAHRDRIAWQYAHDFADVFALGVPALQCAWAAGSPRRAMQAAFLAFLATGPDSHIVRKHGDATAQCVMEAARPWRARQQRGDDLVADAGFARWDEDLKAAHLNPGTSADLAVAATLAATLLQPGLLAAGVDSRFY